MIVFECNNFQKIYDPFWASDHDITSVNLVKPVFDNLGSEIVITSMAVYIIIIFLPWTFGHYFLSSFTTKRNLIRAVSLQIAHFSSCRWRTQYRTCLPLQCTPAANLQTCAAHPSGNCVLYPARKDIIAYTLFLFFFQFPKLAILAFK